MSSAAARQLLPVCANLSFAVLKLLAGISDRCFPSRSAKVRSSSARLGHALNNSAALVIGLGSSFEIAASFSNRSKSAPLSLTWMLAASVSARFTGVPPTLDLHKSINSAVVSQQEFTATFHNKSLMFHVKQSQGNPLAFGLPATLVAFRGVQDWVGCSTGRSAGPIEARQRFWAWRPSRSPPSSSASVDSPMSPAPQGNHGVWDFIYLSRSSSVWRPCGAYAAELSGSFGSIPPRDSSKRRLRAVCV